MKPVENSGARIAIVGAGSVGLIAGALLRKLGVEFDMFDEGEGPCALPQAHVVNTRTSEILQEIGVFEPLRAVSAPIEKVRTIGWVESLAGRRFGKLDLIKDERAAAIRMGVSAVHPLNVGQNRFEEIALARLTELGGSVNYGHKVVAASVEGARGVLEIKSADGAISKRAYDYVLACDGAGSTVRSALGIKMIGPQSLARYASAYFSADISPLIADISGPVAFVGGPDVRGVVIGFDLDSTWAFMCVMPPDSSSSDFGPDVMRELIYRAIGDRSIPIELDGVGTWNMSAQVADAFRSGPFFLVGDSAHRFPPTGGLGLNTGVQDAHNLVWKLALVLEGRAEPDILDSYAEERIPVAAANCQHSMSNAMKMAEVDEVLGIAFLAPVDPAVVNAPERMSSASDLDGSDDSAIERRRTVADIIEQQRPHFDSLKHEVGFLYGHADVFAETVGDYVPSVKIGARLPHAMIDLPEGKTSSHALCAGGGFTLLAGSDIALAELPALPPYVGFHQLSAEVSSAGFIGRKELVLVRPDGHVAWCGGESDAGSLGGALSKFLRQDILSEV